jgi:CheY-like chemotaxis protein
MTMSMYDNKKILIVEDTDTIANSLAAILEKYGEIAIAKNGQEALIRLTLNRFDVIVSDIRMPSMDGVEFYKAAIETSPGIKDRIMFLTASFAEEHLNFFIDNDVPFLYKPAQIEEIESIICKILERSNELSEVKNTGGEG